MYEHYKNMKTTSPEPLQSFYRRYPLLTFPRVLETSPIRSNVDNAGIEATSSTTRGIVEIYEDGVEEEKSEQVDEPMIASPGDDAIAVAETENE